jgi:hypothetical protein
MFESFDLDAVFAARRAEFGNMRMDSENAPEGGESAPVDSSQGESTGTNEGGNPAWNEILGVLPDSLHSVVKPALEKWDNNYRTGLSKVQSQYEPYKEILDTGIEPQNLQYALALLDKIENDPRSIYDALAEHNGWAENSGQGQSEEIDPNEYDPENLPDDPRLLRAEQLAEAVAEYTMQQHQQQQEAQEDELLDQVISGLQEQHGIDPEDEVANKFIMGLMLAGATAEQAFEDYIGMTQQIVTRPRANDGAPVVLGGGGVPSTAINRDQLRDPKARRALVAQMLEQAQ